MKPINGDWHRWQICKTNSNSDDKLFFSLYY
jgi:hypothetical protein